MRNVIDLKRAVVLVVASVVLMSAVTVADAQPGSVSVDGRVQWIAGQTAVLRLDTGPSLTVDLTRVPLDDYAALKAGDRVLVTGVMSDDSRRFDAASIARPGPAPIRTR